MNSDLKIACHTILFGGVSSEEDFGKIDRITAAGFSGIEGIRLGADSNWDLLLAKLEEVGARMAVVDFPGIIMGMDDEELARTADECVEIALKVGCDTIVTMLPRTDGKKIHSFGTCTEHYEQATAKLNLIGGIFNDNGMRLCMHNHIDHMTESWEEMDILMNETDEQSVGICFDTAHAVCAGIDPLKYAERFQPRIRHLHVKDTENLLFGRPYFFKNTFVPLGEGAIDLKPILELFKNDGFDGWYSFELDSGFSKGNVDEEAKVSFEFLKNTLSKQ